MRQLYVPRRGARRILAGMRHLIVLAAVFLGACSDPVLATEDGGAASDAGVIDAASDGGALDRCAEALGVDCDAFAEAYLKASNPGANDAFGRAIALDGDTLAISAPGEASAATGVDGDQADDSAASAGAVYIFERADTTWEQTAYLKASNTAAESEFGASLALDGDTLAVGAPQTAREGEPSDNWSGAVYIFVRTGSGWQQTAYVSAPNTGEDLFGGALSLDEGTLVVGAHGEGSGAVGINGDPDDESEPYSGAVYVFEGGGVSWTQTAYIKASNTEDYAYFGFALAYEDDRLVVSAYGRRQAVYVFERSAGSWSQTAFLEPTVGDQYQDQFGWSVDLSGDTLVVGAPLEQGSATGVNGDPLDNSLEWAGAAYVFELIAGTWTQTAYVKPSNTQASMSFGRSLALDGDRLVVGGYTEGSGADGLNGDEDDTSSPGAGAVYLFARSAPGVWSQTAYIKAFASARADYFGGSVELQGSTLVVGATGEASGVVGDQRDDSADGAGAAYVYRVAP